MVKLSIIIPVYNVELYIEDCIQSILKQKEDFFELILVNDGSTDSSKEICLRYVNDERVIFIDSINKGVSNARNLGIKAARGDYIWFIDSDDTLKSNSLNSISKYIEDNPNLLIFSYEKKYRNGSQRRILNNEILNREKAITLLLKNNYYCGFVWNKIFKKSVIDLFDLTFDENISMNEDLLFCYKYFNNIDDKIITTSNVIYEYRSRKSSALNSKITYKNVSSIKVYEYIYYTCNISDVRNMTELYYLRSYYKYKKYNGVFNKNLISDILNTKYKYFPFEEKIKIKVYKYIPMLKNVITYINGFRRKAFK